MSAVQPFDFNGIAVRVVVDNPDGPWFVAADVARVLGYRDAEKLSRRIHPDDRGTRLVGTPGGTQLMTVLTEPGLYVAIMGSEVSGARDFQRWVTHDVLPTIRRTGSYLVPAQQASAEITRAQLAQMVLDAEADLAVERAKVAELEPQAAAARTVMSADGDWSVRDAAQVLNRDPAIATGQKRLFAYLRELRWLDRKGTPYQRHIELGRLSTRVTTYDHPHTGEPTLGAPQVRITGKGLVELHRHLAGITPVPELLAEDSARLELTGGI